MREPAPESRGDAREYVMQRFANPTRFMRLSARLAPWFAAATVVLLLGGLYLALILWGLRIAVQAKDRFGAIVAFGVVAMLFWHVFINIGMVLGMMPVVGIPLPLLSYGGSFIISTLIGVGLLLNVSMRRYLF